MEEENDSEEEADDIGDQPKEPVATTPASVATTAQPSIFDPQSEEDEILKEAFYGTQDSHIAA